MLFSVFKTVERNENVNQNKKFWKEVFQRKFAKRSRRTIYINE
jgi:hypothetical protein